MAEEYMVKGSTIRSKFDFVRERFGAEAETEFMERFADQLGGGRILEGSWYPFTLFNDVCFAIAEVFFRGDISSLTEVGAYSAEKILTTTYKPFASAKDLEGMLNRFAALHRMVYSHGEMAVSKGGNGRSLTVKLSGAPVYSEPDLQVSAGFYIGAGRLMGMDSVRAQTAMDTHGATIELSW